MQCYTGVIRDRKGPSLFLAALSNLHCNVYEHYHLLMFTDIMLILYKTQAIVRQVSHECYRENVLQIFKGRQGAQHGELDQIMFVNYGS